MKQGARGLWERRSKSVALSRGLENDRELVIVAGKQSGQRMLSAAVRRRGDLTAHQDPRVYSQ